MPASTPSEVEQAMLRVVDILGGMMEFWGFKRNMGRLWGMLYLHDRAMSADELRALLSVSAGTVSTTLQELQKWKVVRKTWVPGERRDYYEAETNIWAMVSRVFRERELNEIKTSIRVFRESREVLKSEETRHPEEHEQIHFIDDRIKRLLELAKIGESLLDGILAGASIDSSPLAMFKLPPEDD